MKPLKILILFLIPISLFAKEEIDEALGSQNNSDCLGSFLMSL